MSTNDAVYCLSFDDRAVAITLEPGNGYELGTYIAHIQSLAGAAAELVTAARIAGEQTGTDPLAPGRIHGLLVGAEVLTGLVRVMALEIDDELAAERRAKEGRE